MICLWYVAKLVMYKICSIVLYQLRFATLVLHPVIVIVVVIGVIVIAGFCPEIV